MATATGNLILTVGSKLGPGGFASLQSAIGMLGQAARAIKNTIVEGEKFAQVWNRLEIDVSKADKATDGLIDTMALMANANKLTKAGIKTTADEYAKLNKFVVEYARATGQDATQVSERLATAIASGTTVSIKRMGIDIKSTGTAAGNFAEVMKKLNENTDDTTIKAEKLSEKMFKLKNNWDTLLGHIMESGSRGGGPIRWLGDAFNFWAEAIGNTARELEQLNKITKLEREIAEYPGKRAKQMKQLQAAAAGGRGADFYALLGEMGIEEHGTMEFTEKELYGGKRGGGGRGERGPESYGVVGETAHTEFGSVYLQRGGEETGAEAANELMRSTYEEAAGVVESKLELMREEQELMLQKEEQEINAHDRLMEWREQEVLQREEDALYYEWFMERHVSMQDQMIMEEQRYMMASRKMWQSGLKGKLQQAQIFMGAISSLQAFENKKNFELMKGIRATETVISGITAAWNAYSALAGIPYVGPALGAAAAIAIIASSAASAAEIASMTWEDQHGGSGKTPKSPNLKGGGGGGGYSGPSAGGGMGGGGGGKEVTVNITMDDSASAWGLMVDENDKASQRGERAFRMG